tara:strand:+ start:1187 stop:1612 length:426 start_codon:yes stop_codon:yes gene_type:complete
MINFFKKKEIKNNDIDSYSKVASLLIHIAKIDQSYTDKEKEIIVKTIVELGAEKENLENIIKNAEKNENDSNQILDFTKEVKNMNEIDKEKIIEALWTVVYSDGNSDMYEESLMRRLTGLLYLDKKKVGDIKEKVKEKLNK